MIKKTQKNNKQTHKKNQYKSQKKKKKNKHIKTKAINPIYVQSCPKQTKKLHKSTPINSTIIDSIKKYNSNYNVHFYNDVIEYFENTKISNEIKENEYELIGHILHSYINQIPIGIKYNKPEQNNNKYYRKITLTEIEFTNFIHCLKTNELIRKNKKIATPSLVKPIQIYVVIDDEDYDIDIKKINMCSLTQLLGIENINILKHINLDYLCKLSATKCGEHSKQQLETYKKLLHNENEQLQNLICAYGSIILFCNGCTTAEDVDVIIYNKYKNEQYKTQMATLSKKIEKKDIDYVRLDDNNMWWVGKKQYFPYLTYALTQEWVNLGNAQNIEHVFFNPKNHFYINGIKCISLKLQYERLLKRNSINAYVDIYALSRNNNYKNIFPITIPHLQFRGGVVKFISSAEYEIMVNGIKKNIKAWHGDDLSIKQIKNMFKFSELNSYNKYIKSSNTFGLFNNLRRFHQHIKNKFLHLYCKNCGSIIDVGSSDLKDIKFWINLNVQHIYALEPSEQLYNIGIQKQNKNNFAKKKITFIRAVGEKLWNNGDAGLNPESTDKLKKMKNVIANCITFEFSIHYMFNDIKTLMKNIKNHSNHKTKIVIHCLNGDLIKKLLTTSKNNKHEIKNGDEVVFSVEKLYQDTDEMKKINVYFKGTHGLDNVVQEYLVENKTILNMFIDNGFQLLQSTKFLDYYDTKFNMEKYEIDVSTLYSTYVFSY
jgi:hypothetical protein